MAFFNGIWLCWMTFLFLMVDAQEDNMLHLGKGASERTVPPSYMMSLYNRLRDGFLPNIGAANTIRSFHPIPGKLGRRDILIFNISGVNPSEYIERVDMHLHWKRPSGTGNRRKKNKNNGGNSVFRLSVLDLDRPSRPEMETVLLRQRPSYTGWHRLDLTDSIIACLDGDDRDHHVIGFSARSEGEGSSVVNVTDVFLSETFLVVFSEDDEHQEIKDVVKSDSTNTSVFRRGREIFDNELPDYPYDKAFGTAREEVQARIKHRALESLYGSKSNSKAEDKWNGKRRRRTRKQHQQQQLKWRKGWWKDDTSGPGDDSSAESEEEADLRENMLKDESTCRKRSLIIDFSKIGWSHWVIAPKTFDAQECVGKCSGTMLKTSTFSNHATLRYLTWQRAAQNGEDVPQLCCVPQILSAAPLLFYDENKNVVLKQFPGMKVENCTCR